VQQQNSGVVEDFILLYSAVYLRIQKWKNYWNRSTFAKVIIKIKVAPFLWPMVYTVISSHTWRDLNRCTGACWFRFNLWIFVHFWCIFCCLFCVVSTVASHCLERLISEMPCYVLSEM